jgi:hypothetical protein
MPLSQVIEKKTSGGTVIVCSVSCKKVDRQRSSAVTRTGWSTANTKVNFVHNSEPLPSSIPLFVTSILVLSSHLLNFPSDDFQDVTRKFPPSESLVQHTKTTFDWSQQNLGAGAMCGNSAKSNSRHFPSIFYNNWKFSSTRGNVSSETEKFWRRVPQLSACCSKWLCILTTNSANKMVLSFLSSQKYIFHVNPQTKMSAVGLPPCRRSSCSLRIMHALQHQKLNNDTPRKISSIGETETHTFPNCSFCWSVTAVYYRENNVLMLTQHRDYATSSEIATASETITFWFLRCRRDGSML